MTAATAVALCHPEIIKRRWRRSGSALVSRATRQWLLKGLRAAIEAFSVAGIEDIYIDGSFHTEQQDPGDVNGYWVEPDESVYDRIDSYWIDFELVFVSHVRKWKWRMWVEHGVEFFIPAMNPVLRWLSRSFSGRIEMESYAV